MLVLQHGMALLQGCQFFLTTTTHQPPQARMWPQAGCGQAMHGLPGLWGVGPPDTGAPAMGPMWAHALPAMECGPMPYLPWSVGHLQGSAVFVSFVSAALHTSPVEIASFPAVLGDSIR